MKIKKLIFEFLRIILVLIIWFTFVYIGFNFAQGPDRSFDLGNGYEMSRWPGSINQWIVDANIPRVMGYYKKIIEERVTAFYVDSTWIVAKTYIHWFAINKQTHEVYYPYKSYEKLCATIGFSFPQDKLVTSYPYLYEKIWPHTKRFVSIMIILVIIPLIGFRRTGRIIKLPLKLVVKIIEKIPE